jgi:hypothetical protein
MDISQPHEPDQNGNQTTGGNETNTTSDDGNQSDVDINDFLNYIDQSDNPTNETGDGAANATTGNESG